jgi:uncharacterized alkaline shock family protein YloU
MMKEVNLMATMTANITVSMTVAALDATTIAAVIQWVQTNVKDKLPANASCNIQYIEIP